MQTVTVTLTPAQSDHWTLGGAAAAQVERELAEHLQEAGVHEAVTVLLDDGSVAFTLEVA